MRVGSFFVIRSPLLEGTRDADAASALGDTPEAAEALAWASPALTAALASGGTDKTDALRSAARYLQRMSGRPTPFSILAGYAAGKVYGPKTQIVFAPRAQYRRILRLDIGDVQRRLAGAAAAEPRATTWVTRRDLAVFPDKIRFANRSQGGDEVTTFDADRSPALDALLACGRKHGGASIEELAAAARSFAGSEREALAFLQTVLENALLVPARTPSVLTADELQPLVDTPSVASVGTVLREIRDLPLGDAAAVRARVESVGVGAGDLIVDLVKPTVEATLGRDVIAHLDAILNVLQRTQAPSKDARWDELAAQLYHRYEGRAVPLGEALDPQRGLPFPSVSRRTVDPQVDRRLTDWLLRLLATTKPGEPLLLEERHLPADKLWELPDSFAMTFSVARDPVSIWDPHLVAAPGTALFARATACLSSTFCDEVRTFLRAGAASGRDELVCDIAYFVAGKSASFSQYPPLQPADLTLTSARTDDTAVESIAVDDVLVFDDLGTIRLVQSSTGRRLRIRPTGAVNPDFEHTTDMFRFLHALAESEPFGHGWSWGRLARAPRLPRVQYRDHVLAPATWSLSDDEVRCLRTAKTQSARWDAAQRLRQQLTLPRHLRFHERADHLLPVDLDDRWSVDAWIDIVKDDVRLSEAFDVSRSLVTGPEGPFHHEVVVPMLGASSRKTQSPIAGSERPVSSGPFEDVPPGGEVLYARIQGDVDELLLVLRDVVDQLVSPLVERGVVRRWFFLPFSTSDGAELRLRLFGEPSVLWSHETLGALRRILDERVKTRSVRALSLETYQRETYRYGGARGMERAEKVFQVSSEIALRLHDEMSFAGDEELDRTLLAHVGSLRAIVDATSLPLERCHAIAARAVRSYERRDQRSASRALAGEKFRALGSELASAHDDAVTADERRALAALLGDVFELSLEDPDAWVVDCLHVHSVRLRTTWHPSPHLEPVAYRVLEKVYAAARARPGRP